MVVLDHLFGELNSLSEVLGLCKPHLPPVLAALRHLQPHLSGPPDLAVALGDIQQTVSASQNWGSDGDKWVVQAGRASVRCGGCKVSDKIPVGCDRWLKVWSHNSIIINIGGASLVNEDVRLVEEEGEDAGVEPVCDEDLPAGEQRYGAPEHRVVVKHSLVPHLGRSDHMINISFVGIKINQISKL